MCVCACVMECYSAFKKNEIMLFTVIWMESDTTERLNWTDTEWSQTEKEMILLTCRIFGKKIQMNIKQKQTTNELMVGVGKNSQGVWDWHAHTAIFKMDNQQGPTV